MNTGAAIRSIREAAGLTQAQCGAAARYKNASSWCVIESRRSISLATLCMVADVLGKLTGRHVTLDELCGRKP